MKLHRSQIETMLKPVEDTIKRLDKQVEEVTSARSKAEALLDDQIKRLARASKFRKCPRKPVALGTWGEMTLENALENADLQPEIDFILQHYTDTEDGGQRTDAVINFTKGRKLIIDSKNLMESYIAFAARMTKHKSQSSLRALQITSESHQGAFGEGVLATIRGNGLRDSFYSPRWHVLRSDTR